MKPTCRGSTRCTRPRRRRTRSRRSRRSPNGRRRIPSKLRKIPGAETFRERNLEKTFQRFREKETCRYEMHQCHAGQKPLKREPDAPRDSLDTDRHPYRRGISFLDYNLVISRLPSISRDPRSVYLHRAETVPVLHVDLLWVELRLGRLVLVLGARVLFAPLQNLRDRQLVTRFREKFTRALHLPTLEPFPTRECIVSRESVWIRATRFKFEIFAIGNSEWKPQVMGFLVFSTILRVDEYQCRLVHPRLILLINKT